MKTISTFPSYICLSLFLLACLRCDGQTFEWATHFGNDSWDEAADIATGNSGNVYCAGNFSGTVDFDPGPGVFTLTAGGSKNVFFSSFDASGNFQWAKKLGGEGWIECNDIHTDTDDNIYITGSFLGVIDFDPSDSTSTLTTSSSINSFVCKFNSSGELTWVKQTGGSLAVNSFSVTTDADGNVYTTGYFDGTADLDPGSESFELTVFGYSDAFVRKLDSSGNFVWAKRFGGPQGEVGHAIAVDGSGNVYTTGTYAETVDFDPGNETFNLSVSGFGEQNIFICKLDASGNFEWAKDPGGDVGYSIALDNFNNVYLTGYYGWDDISINKFNQSGDILWQKTIGAFVGYSLEIDDESNVYCAGQFYGSGDFDPGPETHELTAIGSTDSFINQLDSSGNFVWVKQMGGTEEVSSEAMAMDGEGGLYTTGVFNGTADFDPESSTFNLTSTGSYDVFLQKLTSTVTNVIGNNFSGGMKVYPNPTEGKVTVEFEKVHENLDFTLRNSAGQVVDLKSVFNKNRVDLEIVEPSGIYLLEISDEHNHRAAVKIIKK